MGHKPAPRKAAKSIGRKAPKRKPLAPVVDLDLVELAEVIAENKLDASVEGWFSLPWRNGWNVIALCSDLLTGASDAAPHTGIFMGQLLRTRDTSTSTYEKAENAIQVSQSRFEKAAYRCLQVLIANSDGGGNVYNTILIEGTRYIDYHLINKVISTHRCMDAIGVTPTFTNDGNDRLRRAFKTAWERGLYQAAYSLPQAKKAP